MSNDIKRLEEEIRTAYRSMSDHGLDEWFLPASALIVHYQVGSLLFKFDYADRYLHDFFHPAIAHRAQSHEASPHYSIQLQVGKGPSKLQQFIFDIQQRCEQSKMELTYDPSLSFYYNEWDKEAIIIDHKRKKAILWIESLGLLPSWQRSFSFRKIFNLCLQDTSFQLVHAAGVQIAGRGIVFTGRGGSGKSTLALTALLDGHAFLGDDFILVDSSSLQMMYSMYQIGKLDLSTLNNLPEFTSHTSSYSDHDKMHINLHSWKDQFCSQSQINCMILPVIANVQEPHLEVSTNKELLAACALSTLHLLAGSKNTMMQKIRNLVDGLPCYRFYMHANPHENVAWLEENIASHV